MAKQRPHQAVAGYLRKYVVAPRYRREERLRLVTADGVRISAWRLAGPSSAPATVVLVHGFVNWSRTPRVHAFARLLARDVNVIVPDLRGHGQSSGTSTLGRDEHLDVAAAVGAALPGLPVVTMGVSLGGAAVLMHAGRNPGSVVGAIAVSAPAGWADLDREGAHRVQRWVSGRVGRIVLATLLRTRIAIDCDDLPDAEDFVPGIAPAFTIVVHDPHDWYFGPEHAERIFALAGEPKALWWYDGLGHGTDLLTPELATRVVAEVAQRTATPTL